MDREPHATDCPHCDFSCGMRGMDRCSKCDGTGSVFWVDGSSYPNTEIGYNRAKKALSALDAAEAE